VYTDYLEMFEAEELDAVSVCTPNLYHAPISIAAARAGLHVLCEKPMAASEAEASRMIAAAKENGVALILLAYSGACRYLVIDPQPTIAILSLFIYISPLF
jgi:predicted dehydrogenase